MIRLTLREVFPDGPRDSKFLIRPCVSGFEIVRDGSAHVDFGPSAVAYIGTPPTVSDVILIVEDAPA